MEISKTIEISCDKIKNAYKKDIEKAIDKLFEDYDIYKRGTKDIILKKELEYIFLTGNFEVKYCSAATKSGTKCKHKVLENTNFCGKHLYSTENLRNLLHKQSGEKTSMTKEENDFFIIEKNYESENTPNNSNFKNVLIENAFYYVDDKWVYDKQTMEKVGYVETNEKEENDDIGYILTSDPFILQNF